MSDLDALENQSIYILREAFSRLKPIAMLWSLGKDSNVMLWLARKAFLGHVPFPVVHVDTGKKFPEMYEFRESFSKKWNLNLIVRDCPPVEEIDPSLPPAARSAARKTIGLKNVLEEFKFKGIIAGIRRDEQATRAKERVFSPRAESGAWNFKDQPPEFWDHFKSDLPEGAHMRIHPLLSWTELDIWRYIAREQIPIVDLYYARERQALSFAGRPGHHLADRVKRVEHQRDHRRAVATPGPRSVPAAPWTMSAKTRSSACAHRAICKDHEYGRHIPRPQAGGRRGTGRADRALPVRNCGPCRHGKSSLIGRLLHDTNSLPEGKFAELKAASDKRGGQFEWSFLLDALQAERDQGITIDTTQIFFQTDKRRYVIIDAPGHKEFLKNAISGVAQAQAAILVIDAAEGVREQTRRHALILQLLGLRQIASR
jgi:sulfate adenylyltransferase subunit 2